MLQGPRDRKLKIIYLKGRQNKGQIGNINASRKGEEDPSQERGKERSAKEDPIQDKYFATRRR